MPTIATTSGLLATIAADGLVVARGVPYARAGRLEAPRPLDTNDLRRDATRRGPASPQRPSRLESVTGPVVDDLAQDEHCQVLTVTAPDDADRLPVMVWLHGGAHVSGGGESQKYDGDPLAREGVVVVSVTSRLGALGYLGPLGGEANLGLLDQLEALRWVRANVAAFGGDPDRVTVFGQSAGGDAILSLLALPEAQGLVHAAIVQSAPIGLRLAAHREELAGQVRRGLGERDLRLGSVEDVLTAQDEFIGASQRFPGFRIMPFGPTDGTAPLDHDLESALRPAARSVRLLIGHTRHDAAPFVDLDPRSARLRRLGPLGRVLRPVVVRRATRAVFGTGRIVDVWTSVGGSVRTYRFDWAPDDSDLGACHCLELALLLGGDWSDAPMLAGQPVPADLAASMRRTWAAFARGDDLDPAGFSSLGVLR